jgi:hypothetical protein
LLQDRAFNRTQLGNRLTSNASRPDCLIQPVLLIGTLCRRRPAYQSKSAGRRKGCLITPIMQARRIDPNLRWELRCRNHVWIQGRRAA